MFDYQHYIPVLKTKEGEFWALKNVRDSSKKLITPLLELDKIPRPKKAKPPTPGKKPRKPRPPATLASHLKKKCDKIAAAWGAQKPVFIDTRWLATKEGDPEVVDAVYAAAREAGLKYIPVAYTAHSDTTIAALGSVASTDKRGLMLRLTPNDLSRRHVIDSMLSQMACKPKDVHLLLDYETDEMNLAEDVDAIPYLAKWKTFSVASGSFPASLQKYDHEKWHRVKRPEIQQWKFGISSKSIGRLPAFSDYTVRAPGPPAEGGNPPVVMRYTTEGHCLVRQDGHHMDGDSPEMKAICQSLVARSEFCAAAFSAGDAAIQAIADGDLGTGAPQQWVQYAINHHIEFVVAEDLP